MTKTEETKTDEATPTTGDEATPTTPGEEEEEPEILELPDATQPAEGMTLY